jgi:hypothetical protein
MKRLRVVAATSTVLIVAVLWGTVSRGKAHAAAPPQIDSACVSYVPREWGQYKGGSAQSGLAFEDNAGTLRFITNLPCGATPIVALEVRRPSPKGSNNDN